MPKLQIQNVGQAPVVVKDFEGYSGLVMEVDPGQTATKDTTHDVIERLAPLLKELEGEVRDADQNQPIVAIRWSVLQSDTVDDRAMGEGLAGLPSLNELQAANYSTGGGGANVVATGTGLLGNQDKATLAVVEGAAQLDLEAVAPGAPGNAISVEVVAGVGALAVSVVANKITVTLAAGGSTVLAVANAINAEADAKLLVQASEGAAGNLTLAQAEQWLSGGKGPGVSLSLNGTACVLTEVTDTQLTFDIPSGISAASRIVPLEYQCGPHKSRLSVPVAV